MAEAETGVADLPAAEAHHFQALVESVDESLGTRGDGVRQKADEVEGDYSEEADDPGQQANSAVVVAGQVPDLASVLHREDQSREGPELGLLCICGRS